MLMNVRLEVKLQLDEDTSKEAAKLLKPTLATFGTPKTSMHT